MPDLGDDPRDRGAGRHEHRVGGEAFAMSGDDTRRTSAADVDGARTGLRDRPSAEQRELLEKHPDEGRKVDPAFAGIEDRALGRDGAGIDPRRCRSDLLRHQETGVVTDVGLVSERLRDPVPGIVRVPGQAAVEPQPRCVGILGRKGAIAVDADHAQAVIRVGAEAGRIQPREGAPGRFAGKSAIREQGDAGAEARKLRRGGDAEDAAADDRDAQR